jgi:simple sugar transport system permease protein
VSADHLPAFGPAHASVPAGRRLLARALARPSLAALVGLVVGLVFFGLQARVAVFSGGLVS